MPKFEFFLKSDPDVYCGRVNCRDYEEFRQYWQGRCDPDEQDFRQVDDGQSKTFQRRILKQPADVTEIDDRSHFQPMTDALCDQIAADNGEMTGVQVHFDLMAGKSIYVGKWRYVLEA